MSGRRTQITDMSSQHGSDQYGLPKGRDADQMSVASSAATSFKKRKLSISVAKHMTPQKEVTPRDIERRNANTIDRNRYNRMDQQSLNELDAASFQRGGNELDRISVNSGLFTSKAS